MNNSPVRSGSANDPETPPSKPILNEAEIDSQIEAEKIKNDKTKPLSLKDQLNDDETLTIYRTGKDLGLTEADKGTSFYVRLLLLVIICISIYM